MPKKITTQNNLETKKLASDLAKEIVKIKPTKTARIIGFVGDLGAGKTTFIQGFLHALGVKNRIISPTFLILRPYAVSKKTYNRVYHIDAYRLHFEKELLALGFKQIISNPKNIVLIEWADKIKNLLPAKTIWLRFKHGKTENERVVIMK